MVWCLIKHFHVITTRILGLGITMPVLKVLDTEIHIEKSLTITVFLDVIHGPVFI
jgi:hypothetical protein